MILSNLRVLGEKYRMQQKMPLLLTWPIALLFDSGCKTESAVEGSKYVND